MSSFSFIKRNCLLCTTIVLYISCSRHTQQGDIIYSKFVKDSFALFIDRPVSSDPVSIKAVVFYMDANLKMGKEIRRQIYLPENEENLKDVLFVGVGHIGNYRKLSRRDFIPPKIKHGKILDGSDVNFGQGEIFYHFLTGELIPFIIEKFPNQGPYSFIGHSFSGLFAFYCMLHKGSPFTNYIALSPSLWTNYNNFFDYEETFHESADDLPHVTLYHACGTGEWANKVLKSSRRMNKILLERNYSSLQYIYQEHPGKSHNGVVPVSLSYVLSELNFKNKSIEP